MRVARRAGAHCAIGARFWFYGADDNQLTFLKRVKQLPAEQLDAAIQKVGHRSSRSGRA